MKRTFIIAAICLVTVVGLFTQCGKKGTPTNGDGDNTTPIAPRVTASYPADTAAGLPRNTLIYVTFDKAMDHAATEGALTVTGMAGTKSWSNYILIFKPDSLFKASDTVRFAISTAAKDNAGTPLAAAVSYSFICGADADTARPVAVDSAPSGSAVNVNAQVMVWFNEKLAPWSDAAITLKQGAMAVAGSDALVSDSILRFIPAALAFNTTYTVTVDTARCIDRCGNRMAAPFTWSFTTEVDNVPPTVVSTTPANGDTLVSVNVQVRIRFSEAMNTGSVNAALSATPVLSYTAAWSGDTTVTLTMTDTLSFHTLHQVTIGTGAMDKANNHLASAYSFSFKTARGLYIGCMMSNETYMYQQHDLKPERYLPYTSGVTQVRASPGGDMVYLLTNNGLHFRQVHNHNNEPFFTNLSSGCYGIAVSPNGLRLAVSDTVHNYVYLIDASNGQMLDTIYTLGAAPKGLVFSGNSRYLYVLCKNTNQVEIYDLNNIGDTPSQQMAAYDGEEMTATPAGDIVFAACGPGVTAISTSNHSVLYNITVGNDLHPFGLAVSPDELHLAVSWYNEGLVRIYNAATGAFVTSVTVGANPKGLCYSPGGKYLYVANSGSGTFTPVRRNGATYITETPIAVGAGPWGIAVTP